LRPAIAAMSASLLHRGPDSDGLFLDEGVALAHRRLKIIDLSDRAAQPMSTPDGRYTIAYNGEIYNYRELRDALQSRGVRFFSASDTEVLLAGYALHGLDILPKLNGIFAFAMWDATRRSLLLVRDHVGVKPLFYHDGPDAFLFASEVKALIAGGLQPAVNAPVLAEALAFGHVTGEDTLYAGIRRLAPGCWLRLDADGSITSGTWFHTLPSGIDRDVSYPDAVRRVADLLDAAVRLQLVSDVPLGTLCSGGLDSSGITALCSRLHAALHTFSIRVDCRDYDESAWAQEVSAHLGTTHHVETTDASLMARRLPEMIALKDVPLRHSNAISIYQISVAAKRHVTVLLTGEGADELFGGYYTHAAAHRLGLMQHYLPRALASPAMALLRRSDHAYAVRAVNAMRKRGPAALLASLRACIDDTDLARVAPSLARDDSHRLSVAERCWHAAAGDAAQAAMFCDQLLYLPTILERQDIMSMGASIESRVPYLDPELIAFVNRLPAGLKIRNGNGKAVLMEAFRDMLPASIYHRKKHAFGLPIHQWMRLESFAPYFRLLAEGELIRSGILARTRLMDMVRSFERGRNLDGEFLWNAVNIELWWRIKINGSGAAALGVPAASQVTAGVDADAVRWSAAS
jgi:asparagine synthase (glutamine-hydrolysing)